MKTTHPRRLWVTFFAGATLLGAVTKSHAQTITTSYTNTFDTSAKVSSWHHWYDINAPTYNGPLMDWDSTMNNTVGHPGSGSLTYSNTWPGHAAGVSSQGQDVFYGLFAEGGIFDTSQSIDATKYDSVTFDIHVDASSPTNSDGDICVLQVGLFHGYNFYVITNITIPTSATNGWTHYVAVINKATAPAAPGDVTQGIGYNINCYDSHNAALIQGTGTTKFWLDNIQINRTKEKIPPPVMSSKFKDPIPGLNLGSSTDSSDQYQRNNLKLLNNSGVGWLGQSNFTYSLTITNFPSGATYPGHEAHIFITTGPGTSAYMDYVETNLVWLSIQANGDGTAYASFRYKINEPQANSNLFGAEFIGVASAGTLSALGAPTALGTWSMTFNNDTNVTIQGPGGVSTNFNMRPEAVAPFVDPLNVVFGDQPNSPGNVGQTVVLSAASITNQGTSGSIVNDNFLADSSLDTGTWTPLAAAANTVQLFPVDPGQKLVKWTLPDTGYGLQTTTNVSNANSWSILTGNEATGAPLLIFSSEGFRNALVPSARLGPNQDFFRMFTRGFAKLQVLMPGETAAPGTATGKTGTPDAQQVDVPFNITVNAVDATWHLALTADDTVHITTSGGSPTLPADAPLVAGTVTLSVTFGAAGSFTVTASDATDGSKTPNTGTATTVNP